MDIERKNKIAKLKANHAEAPAQGNDAGMVRYIGGLIANAITSRADFMRTLFDKRRDLDEECGYEKRITVEMYRKMYDRELGRRVVDIYPSETWKEFPDIYEDEDPDTETEFEAALIEIDKHHHLLQYMERVDRLSGIGHYGLILWGIDDGKPLYEPVEGYDSWAESVGMPDGAYQPPQRKIIFIRTLDNSLARIAEYEQDVMSPRYGLPTYYNITLADPCKAETGAVKSEPSAMDTKVHWSRITHIADNRNTSEVLGAPRQEVVWNRLYDLCKVLGGSGEMYWKGGFPGLSLETNPGLENAELDEETTRQKMSDYMNGLQRYIALNGMSAKSLAPQIADPSQTFEVHIKTICIMIGVPYRVFMGIEEGVVSGDQATKAWNTRLANRQARYVTPMIINPVLQRLTDLGVLPKTAEPMGWVINWPSLEAEDELRDADVAVKKTEALSKYIGGGVDTLIPPMQYLTLVCGFEESVAAMIRDAAVEHIGDIASDQPTQGHPPGPTPEELAAQAALDATKGPEVGKAAAPAAKPPTKAKTKETKK